MKKRNLGIGIVLVLLAAACNKPNDLCEEEKLTAAFVLDYPDTVQINVPFTFEVGYVVENSCGDFGKFEAEIEGNMIEAKLKTNYKGCNCDDQFEEKKANYPLTFDEAGTYELRFWIAENEYDSYFVVAVE